MRHKNVYYVLSLLLGVLLIVANGIGLLKPEIMYASESADWFSQSVGQDIVDLVLVFPSLIICSSFIYRNSKKALLVWAGILAYLIYTFTIYCFAIHFNSLFVIYCLILGLSFYLFASFILSQYRMTSISSGITNAIRKITGVYFVAIAGLFYLLWLGRVIPASVNGTVPPEIVNARLVTNPVHVLDLSICLPGILISGIMILRHSFMGIILAPVVLAFLILMDLTIAGLMIVQKWKGFPVNNILLASMFALAIFSFVLLWLNLRAVKSSPTAT